MKRLLTVDRLVTHPDPDQLRDDAPHVRAWEERIWREEQGVRGVEEAEEQLAAAAAVASGVDASVR